MTFAIFNFNTYLGGGETLIVRWAQYLQNNGFCFKIFCKTGSYIEGDLHRVGIPNDFICPISLNTSYYYLDQKGRQRLKEEIISYLRNDTDVCLISLNTRELFTVFDIANNNPKYRIAHLVLHNQDNLYVCQSLLDKIKLRFIGKRSFSRKKQIILNVKLYNIICDQSIVIPQSELQAELLRNEFGIHLEKEKAVPLPSCDFKLNEDFIPANNKKIIWIGRIVDFKIPSLIAMINFVSRRKDYSLTVVGDGELNSIDSFINNKKIERDNIRFIGKVAYSDLGGIIKNHAIGYAMGTSIVEIGKYGIPVIMALGAPKFKLFKNDICGGVYVDQSRGNVGDTLYYEKSKDPIILIDDAISKLEDDYDGLRSKCFETLKASFDETTDFGLYMKWLKLSQTIVSDLQIPYASWLRRLLFNLVEN